MSKENMTSEMLPKEIGRGKLKIAEGFELEVIQLDNGQRLITPEGLAAFLEWINCGGEPN